MSALATAQQFCERDLIASYVDGELDQDVESCFEDHLQTCAPCRAELRAHRLVVCELDAALTATPEIPVPVDFSRVIAARASSDMRGVRTRSENRKALVICVILALGGFALLGATARDRVFIVTGRFVSKVFGVVGFIATAVYDSVAGVVVIVRVLSRKLIVESGSLAPLLVLLAVAVVVLTRLLSNSDRTGATE